MCARVYVHWFYLRQPQTICYSSVSVAVMKFSDSQQLRGKGIYFSSQISLLLRGSPSSRSTRHLVSSQPQSRAGMCLLLVSTLYSSGLSPWNAAAIRPGSSHLTWASEEAAWGMSEEFLILRNVCRTGQADLGRAFRSSWVILSWVKLIMKLINTLSFLSSKAWRQCAGP